MKKRSVGKPNVTDYYAFSKTALARCGAMLLIIALVFPSACSRSDPRPNVLFVLWDTTRSDRMSLYGHPKPTTPFLDNWATGGRVYTNCISPGNSTIPAHGSLFTGLYPVEHGASNKRRRLDDRHETLAELFQEAGYGTYLFSANPHIAGAESFAQGFDVEEHPWDSKYHDRALNIVREKIDPEDRSSALPDEIRSGEIKKWAIKACGRLAGEGLLEWLTGRETKRPYFAFLNYMEAHRPFIPAREFRERIMTADQVRRSFAIDRSWDPMWEYTFRLREYPRDELEIMALTYDAGIAELDALFEDLIGMLNQGGYLENTIIVLTSDHGEHLGEHHMLDHQYSVYEELLRVPLILHFPAEVKAGRVGEPVVTFDLFPTLLGLAKIDKPAEQTRHTVDLLRPLETRPRMAEYLADFEKPITTTLKSHPGWDAARFRRRLTALYLDRYKLIRTSDGSDELYDLSHDPLENENLAMTDSTTLRLLLRELRDVRGNLRERYDTAGDQQKLSNEERERLEALGYTGDH